MRPLVTTVVPTYRRPLLLRRALLSALEQEGVSLKVCVYDNASGDQTPDIVDVIASQDPRIVYHCHDSNIGGGANFLYGMERIDTPYFSFLSDDDYLLPGFYKQAVSALEKNPQAMCWIGLTLNVDEAGTIWDARLENWPREGLFEPPDGFLHMTGGKAPTWTGILFRREIIENIGTLDLSMRGPSDMEYLLRLAARYPYVLSKHPAAVFTLNRSSFSFTEPMSSFWPGWIRMLEKFSKEIEMDEVFRRKALTTLKGDARSMLLRRGANAMADGRIDFVAEVAKALREDCNRTLQSRFLQVIAAVCKHSSLAQKAYTYAYRAVESRIVKSKGNLQSKYGALLRRD